MTDNNKLEEQGYGRGETPHTPQLQIDEILVAYGNILLNPKSEGYTEGERRIKAKHKATQAILALLKQAERDGAIKTVNRAVKKRWADDTIKKRPEEWQNGYTCGVSELHFEMLKELQGKEQEK